MGNENNKTAVKKSLKYFNDNHFQVRRHLPQANRTEMRTFPNHHYLSFEIDILAHVSKPSFCNFTPMLLKYYTVTHLKY